VSDAKTFKCPGCGSALEPDGDDKEVKCAYCGSTVIVPEELRDQDEDEELTPDIPGSPQHVPWLVQNGADATLRVDSVLDTGKMIDMKPIINFSVSGKTADGKQLTLYNEIGIPRNAIPRKGDMIKIKYNPARPNLDFAVQLDGQFIFHLIINN